MSEARATPSGGRRESADGRFDVDHLKNRLGSRAVSGGMITTSAQIVRIALNLLSIAILARLIPPEEFGVVALVLPISYLASDVAQFALGQVTIQRQRITQGQVSGLFWANLLIAGAATVLLILASGLFAAFYGDPRVSSIMMALATMTLLAGAASQFSAILNREMRFWTLQASGIAAEICAIVCAVAAAYAGLSYWAIVIQMLVRQSTMLVIRAVCARWRPDGPGSLRQVRGLIAMSGDLATFSLLTQASHGLGMVMIGRVLGDVQAGLFLRACNVSHWPATQLLTPLGAVVTSALSRVANDRDRLDAAFERVTIQAAMVAVPMGAVVLALAEPFTFILLGPQWQEVTFILTALGLITFAAPLASVVRWRLVATGSTGLLRRFGMVAAPVTLVGYAIGVQFGSVATALILGIVNVSILLPLLVWLAGRHDGLHVLSFFRIVLPFCLEVAAISLTVYWTYRSVTPDPTSGGLPAIFLLGVAAILFMHLCFCAAVPRFRREVSQVSGKILAFAR